jgi:membrane fusion protein (multidrug efflux system)
MIIMLMNHCKNTCVHIKQQHTLIDSIHLLSLFFLFLGFIILAYWLLIGQFYKNSENAYVTGNPIRISPLISGQLTEIFVKENELVIKGQPIATIDKANAYITLKKAEANLSASTIKVIEMHQFTNELQSRAQTALKIAENNLKKAQELYKHYLDTKQDNLIEKLKQAQISVEKAADSFEEANLEYNAAMSLPIDSDIYQNPIMIESINQFRIAYLNWLASTVYAPDTGYVIQCQTLAGQAVNTNTILMAMVPLNEIWVNVSINETDLRNIHNGQRVKLTLHIYKNNMIYEGKVISYDSKTIHSPTSSHSPNQKTIRIQVNPEQFAKNPLRIGLAMSASINTRNKEENDIKKIEETSQLVETQNYQQQLADADQLINKIIQDNTKNIILPKTHLGKL